MLSYAIRLLSWGYFLSGSLISGSALMSGEKSETRNSLQHEHQAHRISQNSNRQGQPHHRIPNDKRTASTHISSTNMLSSISHGKITNTYVAERIVRRTSLYSKYSMSNHIPSTIKRSSTTISPTHISLNHTPSNSISSTHSSRQYFVNNYLVKQIS